MRGHRIALAFRGKHKIQVRTTLVDEELAAAMKELLAAKGARVFQYEWEGAIYNLTSKRLNDYVKLYLGPEFTAKDFRTWGGTLTAAVALAERASRDGFPETKTDAEALGQRRDAPRGGGARKYAGGVPRLIRLAGGDRPVSRGQNDRGFPAAAFARGRRARHRARRRGAGPPQPAPVVAHSAGASGRVIPLAISATFTAWHAEQFSFATTAAKRSTKRRAP